MLHGEIKVNDREIATWRVVNKGRVHLMPNAHEQVKALYADYVVYEGRVEYEGNTRYYYILHKPIEGPIVATYKALIAADNALKEQEWSKSTVWHDFCAVHSINPYSLLD